MEAAIWLLGVLEVVATQHKLQRPGGLIAISGLPWKDDLIILSISVLCFSLIITL